MPKADAPAPLTAHKDPYPSRTGAEPEILHRSEPTVFAASVKDAPLSCEQLQHYNENGFVVLDSLFDDSEVRTLQQELSRLRAGCHSDPEAHPVYEPGGDSLRSIFAIHAYSPLFHRLAIDSRLVDTARFILADDVYVHQSRLNYKPGFRGKEFFWHSDFETWHVEDGMPAMRALSMSVTLTENSAYNGALMLIPRSHRYFVSCKDKTPEDHHLQSLRRQDIGVPCDRLLRKLADQGGITTVDARPGSVIVFDCNLMHGSNGNITPYPRSNAFFVYNAISNRVGRPYCDQPPRPEYICSRDNIAPVTASRGRLYNG